MHEELERWLEAQRRRGASTRPELAGMARMELALGRRQQAIALFERALAAKGPYEASVRAELEAVRQAERP